MKGAIRNVCEFCRSTPAGSNSISTSFGAATAASVPSNGRYANDAVEPATTATPTVIAHVSNHDDCIFEIRCVILMLPPLRSPFKAPDGTPTRQPVPTMPHAPQETAGPPK